MWSEKFMLERKWSVPARDRGANPRKVAEFLNSSPGLTLGQDGEQGREENPGWPVGNKIDYNSQVQHTHWKHHCPLSPPECRANDGMAWHWIPGCRNMLMLSTQRTLLQCPETLMTQQHPLRLLHKGQGKVSSSMGIKIRAWTFCVTSKPWKHV